MNSSSAFQMTVDILGSRYGPVAQFFNAAAAAYLEVFMSLFGFCLSGIYFLGPVIPLTGLGFWESRSLVDICSAASRLSPEYWIRHPAECEVLAYSLFENFVYSLASLHWGLLLCYVMYRCLTLLRQSIAALFSQGRAERGRLGYCGRDHIKATFGPFVRQMTAESIGTDHKWIEIYDTVKVKNPVSDLGCAYSVVQD